ncbi:MAG: radical SAM protein [Planctomycetota bacterium]
MRVEGKLYRPPSEADAYILQATIGCSWNKCTYCDMYREKSYRERPLEELFEDMAMAEQMFGPDVQKWFIADGDALHMPLDTWLPLLERGREAFPRLRRTSCYAMASNVLEKSDEELRALREAGLTRLYIGPESGDDLTLKRIAKGSTHDEHVEAARRAKAAGLEISAIFLLGAGGTERSEEHARESARLATAMDPEFLAALTLTVVEGTPMARAEAKGHFTLPPIDTLLSELRTFVAEAAPTDALFRTNHASNYLPLAGRLPADRNRIVEVLDRALRGDVRLRDEWMRGL